MNSLQEKVKQVIGDFGDNGKVSVIFQDLNGNTSNNFSIEANRIVPAASVIKLSILASVLQAADNKEFSLNDTMEICSGDMFGEFKAQHHPLRAKSYRIEDLCRLMIDLSDNLATNMLIRLIGMDRINREMNERGLKHSSLERKFLDFEAQSHGFENKTTPAETIKMLTYFIDKDAAGVQSATLALEILESQCDTDYLSQYMPLTYIFAHKTGHIPGAMHDVGIITTDDKRKYLISVMTTDLKDDLEGKRFLNKLGETIFKNI